jgi:hypothetical protein
MNSLSVHLQCMGKVKKKKYLLIIFFYIFTLSISELRENSCLPDFTDNFFFIFFTLPISEQRENSCLPDFVKKIKKKLSVKSGRHEFSLSSLMGKVKKIKK